MESFKGDLYALFSGISWAVAVIMFRVVGVKIKALSLNIFKMALCAVLFWITSLALGFPVFADMPKEHWFVLFLSGFLGIGLADTFYLASLNRVGAATQAIVDRAYCFFFLLLSFTFLGERLTLLGVLGAALVIVALVIGTLPDNKHSGRHPEFRMGICFGIASHACMAASIVVMKPVIDTQHPVWILAWRFVIGFVLVAPWAWWSRGSGVLREAFRFSNLKLALPASLLGSYLGALMWVSGFKYTLVSKAAILNSLSAFYIFIMAWLILKEPISFKKCVAIVIGFVGAALVSLKG